MDDKTKKDLVEVIEQTLDRKFDEKFIPLFNQGFEQLVMPALEDLENGLRKEMKEGFDKVNTRLDAHDRRTDHLAIQVGDHEKRLKKLKSKRVVAA